MVRIRRGNVAKKRRKNILKLARGFCGAHSKLFRTANQQFMKSLKYFFIFLFLLSCGYSPVYQIKKDTNIKIDVINFAGDKKIGREIIRGLENFKKNEGCVVSSVHDGTNIF